MNNAWDRNGARLGKKKFIFGGFTPRSFYEKLVLIGVLAIESKRICVRDEVFKQGIYKRLVMLITNA